MACSVSTCSMNTRMITHIPGKRFVKHRSNKTTVNDTIVSAESSAKVQDGWRSEWWLISLAPALHKAVRH